MRVLFITGEFPPMQGGVGDYTDALARELAKNGVQVRAVTSVHAKGEHAVPVLPIITHWNWAALLDIWNSLRDFQPDIVHIQYQTGAFRMHPAINFLPRLTPIFLGKMQTMSARVVTFHDLRVPYLFPKAGGVRSWVTRELAQSCDGIIATNAEDFEGLLAWSCRPALIPIGSNIPTRLPSGFDRAAWRLRLGVAENDLLLCHFGFVNARKGIETLVRALAEIPDAKLLMVGGKVGASDPTNIAFLGQMQDLIAERDLTTRVLWTGYTPPEIVTANMRAADLCVLPYREGATFQHGTLMAAIAHAMPIVTTAAPLKMGPAQGSGGMVRQSRTSSNLLPRLADCENCLLVPPDDPHALAQAICRAAAAPELRARIGAGAGELAAFFSWDRIAEQHLDFYGRLLGRP